MFTDVQKSIRLDHRLPLIAALPYRVVLKADHHERSEYDAHLQRSSATGMDECQCWQDNSTGWINLDSDMTKDD